jgi:hypothetical protein
MLLKLLSDQSGSSEVENSYLKHYRQALRSLVEATPAPREPISALDKLRNKRWQESADASPNPARSHWRFHGHG